MAKRRRVRIRVRVPAGHWRSLPWRGDGKSSMTYPAMTLGEFSERVMGPADELARRVAYELCYGPCGEMG
jgi:hypothetical protein